MPQKMVDAMLVVAKIKKGEVVYDLGCAGGSTAVITAANKYGAYGIGFSLEKRGVDELKKKVLECEVGDRVDFRHADYFDIDLRNADVIIRYFGSAGLDERMILQLKKAKPGARLISYDLGEKPQEMKGIQPDEVKVRRGPNAPVQGGECDDPKVYLWRLPVKQER
jgi:SAM-dependent methyltransferase